MSAEITGRWCTVLAITADQSIESNQIVQIPEVPAETKRVQEAKTGDG